MGMGQLLNIGIPEESVDSFGNVLNLESKSKSRCRAREIEVVDHMTNQITGTFQNPTDGHWHTAPSNLKSICTGT